jgi:predicted nucleotidyltransferase
VLHNPNQGLSKHAIGTLQRKISEMIPQEKIDKAIRILVEIANPSKIILFGSYARGEAREDSDLDLLVIEPALSNRLAEIVRLRNALRPLRIPVDVIVASKDEIEDWGHLPGTLYYWALKEGKALHETTH